MDVTRIGPVFGARVAGLDLRAPIDGQTIASIKGALAEHEVLVFREQQLEAEDMLALGRGFGELLTHPFSPSAADAPELIVFDNHNENPPTLTDVWHADETFRVAPPAVTILHALISPPLGGGTTFASMRAAYEMLSDRMKLLISGLTARHDFGRFGSLFPDTPEALRRLHEIELNFPPPSHPVVRIHPETGKPVLYVNRHFTRQINELPEEEGAAILQFLLTRPAVPELQLTVEWTAGTLVMWDNRSVQHYARHDYFPQRRRMQRVTISGDVPAADAPSPGRLTQRLTVHNPPLQEEDAAVPRRQVLRPFERANS